MKQPAMKPGNEGFVLRAGDTLMAPRDVPHQLRYSGNIENHYLLMFSPSGFEEFLMATAVLAPDNAADPTDPPPITIRNVHELAAGLGIHFRQRQLSTALERHGVALYLKGCDRESPTACVSMVGDDC